MNVQDRMAGQGPPPVRLLGVLAVAYYLPVILLWARVIPFAYRFHVLVMMSAAMAAYSVARGRRASELGFVRGPLGPSLAANGALSLLLLGLMLALHRAHLIRPPTVPNWNLFYVFYVFVSSPCQEFLFRCALFAEMRGSGITNPAAQVCISAVTYCFLHVIYNDAITLGVTLVMGIVWGILYQRYPSFWGVTLSHAVLGAVSIAVGLI